MFLECKYGPSTVSFSLAADAMTGAQLAAFVGHFKPGKSGKLILSEKPYLYTYVMLESVPTLNFIPFKIGNIIEYRGEATLTFHMSDPRWYSDYVSYSSFLATISTKFWNFESGIPMTTYINDGTYYIDSNKKIVVSGTGTAIAYSDNTGLSYTANNSLAFYNAGNYEAATKISFSVSLGTISGKITFFDVTPGSLFYFQNISLDGTEKFYLRAPKVIQQFNKALDLLANYSSVSINAATKQEIRAIMYSNLDHPLILARMNSAIASQSSYANIVSNFCGFFSSSTISFVLDGPTMSSTISYQSADDGTVEEKSSDVMASRYLIVAPNAGLNSSNKYVATSTISASEI